MVKKNIASVLLLFTLVFMVSNTLPLYSQEIISIEITGLKRTKQYIANYPLEKFLGRDGTTLDLNEVEAAVRDTGILEPAKIELIQTDNGMILHVEMAEKWTIIPYPVLSVVPGAYNMGLYIIDSNFLGIRDQAAIGGTFGTPGWMVMAMYGHTPNKRGLPGWNTNFLFNHGNRVDQDRDLVVHRYYFVDQLRFSFGMQHALTNFLAGGASVSFTYISINDDPRTFNPPDSGGIFLGFSTALATRTSSWDGYLLSQRSLSVDYGYNHGIRGPSYHQMGYTAIYDRSLIPGFRLSLRSGGIRRSAANLVSEVDPLFEIGPARSQVSILPGGFTAGNYLGLSAGLEKHIFRIPWGTLSIIAAWQLVYSQGLISGRQFSNGPFGEIRFYMSRIAVPALGFGIAYNMNSGRLQFGLNMSTGL